MDLELKDKVAIVTGTSTSINLDGGASGVL